MNTATKKSIKENVVLMMIRTGILAMKTTATLALLVIDNGYTQFSISVTGIETNQMNRLNIKCVAGHIQRTGRTWL